MMTLVNSLLSPALRPTTSTSLPSAVGLKRRHLTQMFLFEGTTYTLAASAIGVLAGVLVGRLMITVLFPGRLVAGRSLPARLT